MSGFQKVIIEGRLSKDPETKVTPGGTALTKFSIPVSEKYGDKPEKTFWFNVVVWGKLAEVVAKYMSKGSEVLVVGTLEMNEWEKDGQKRQTVNLIASEVKFVGSKKESKAELAPGEPDNDGAPGGDDDDIPF